MTADRLIRELCYRTPLDWRGLIDFFRRRAVRGVEVVDGESYARTIGSDGEAAIVRVSPTARRIRVESCGAASDDVVPRVRKMFDLDADPKTITAVLACDPDLRTLVKHRPGLRLPGGWDPFEIAVRAIVGQQVTVAAATTFCGRLVARFGKPIRDPAPGLTHLFPTAEALAGANLVGIGLTRARGAALSGFCRAVASGELALESDRGLEEVITRLAALPGLGEWTAHYIALRAFGERDAFPAGDLGLRRAFAKDGRLPSARELAARAEAWRPWRGYAAIYLWSGAISFPLSASVGSQPAADARGRRRRSSPRSRRA